MNTSGRAPIGASLARTNSSGTSAMSSNRSMANAARPTGELMPAMGRTSAVDDIASATPSAAALPGASPAAHSPPPISSVPSTISAAPIPKIARRIAARRRKLSSMPIEKSKRMMPNSANGSMPCWSVMVIVLSHGRCSASAPNANGPTIMPTRMKPMTGEILSRAKAGITIPAAPRITSASFSPSGAVPAVMDYLCLFRRGGDSG